MGCSNRVACLFKGQRPTNKMQLRRGQVFLVKSCKREGTRSHAICSGGWSLLGTQRLNFVDSEFGSFELGTGSKCLMNCYSCSFSEILLKRNMVTLLLTCRAIARAKQYAGLADAFYSHLFHQAEGSDMNAHKPVC